MTRILAILAVLLLAAGCGSGDKPKTASGKKASAQTSRNCRLETVPSGAGVWEGDSLLGCTPFPLTSCMGRKLTLKSPGCESLEILPEKEGVSVGEERIRYTEENGTLTALVEIPPAAEPACVLLCRSVPEGADVLLDGEFRGTTPLELTGLSPKAYELSIKLADREPVNRRIRWKEGETRQTVEVRLASQTIEFYRKKLAEEPLNLLHYADMGHHLVLEGELVEAMSVFKEGLKQILDGKRPRDPFRLWAELDRVVTVQYMYGDERTVEVARRILLGMLDELWDEYRDIRDISYYRCYVSVADRLKYREAAQEKLDAALKRWPADKTLTSYLKRGYKKN